MSPVRLHTTYVADIIHDVFFVGETFFVFLTCLKTYLCNYIRLTLQHQLVVR